MDMDLVLIRVVSKGALVDIEPIMVLRSNVGLKALALPFGRLSGLPEVQRNLYLGSMPAKILK